MQRNDFHLHGTYLYNILWVLTYVFEFTSLSVLLLFPYQSHSSPVFYSTSSNIDEILSINPSAVFFFLGGGDFNVHHKDCITILVELIDLVNYVILSQMILLNG